MNREKRPDILLITTDQQRFDTLGRFKPPFLRTPHLDNLAARGITFSNAYADCPVCVPARAGLLSGRSVFSHRMYGNARSSDYLGSRDTLPDRLRALGYQTAAVGKMHFHPPRARHGFEQTLPTMDYYRSMHSAGHPLQPHRTGLGQNELSAGMSTVPEALTLTNWIAEQCRQFITVRRDPTAPFFLWCSFSKPHPPLDPPEPYYSMYRDCPLPGPVIGDWAAAEKAPEAFRRAREVNGTALYSPGELRAARAAYYGLITQLDYNIGLVLGALREISPTQSLDETLIIFMSDHGEYLGDHGQSAKSFWHEVSAHVPLLVKVPDSWRAELSGRECPHLVTFADVMPTMLKAAGARTVSGSDGQDLVALARGELPGREFLEGISGGPADNPRASIAITDGRWKYLWFPEGGAEQLFDLAEDRYETVNLAGRPTGRAARRRLRAALIERHRQRDLGYVRGDRLAARPPREDRRGGKRNISPWIPGYPTDMLDKDVNH